MLREQFRDRALGACLRQMIDRKIPLAGRSESSGTLFVQADQFFVAQLCREPAFQKAPEQRVQSVLLVCSRCIGLRDKNVSTSQRTQLIRAMVNAKRGVAYGRINTFE